MLLSCDSLAQQGGTSLHQDLAPGSEIEQRELSLEQSGGNADIRGFSMEITGVSSLPPPCERPLYVLF